MAEPRPPVPVLLVAAVFSRHADALPWRGRLEEAYGPVERLSPAFVFDQTDYYAATMGTDLRKQFLAFRDLIAPDRLAEIKLHTNALESELAQAGSYPEARPVNIDPGYLNLGKFLLATTKDQAHRVYLRDGVYAEVTLPLPGRRLRAVAVDLRRLPRSPASSPSCKRPALLPRPAARAGAAGSESGRTFDHGADPASISPRHDVHEEPRPYATPAPRSCAASCWVRPRPCSPPA